MILPKNSSDFYGILHQKKKIVIKCDHSHFTRYNNHDYVCKDSIDKSAETYFCSDNKKEGWIAYLFPYHPIDITNYSITVPKVWPYGPISYTLSGLSSLTIKWLIIDEVNNSGLQGAGLTITKAVQTRGVFSALNITMHGHSYEGANKYQLRIAQFDVFGVVKYLVQTCGNSMKRSLCHILAYSILVMS